MDFGYLIGAGALGSLITLFLQHLLEKVRYKNEREFSLEKEEFFETQKVAMKLMGFVFRYDQYIENLVIELQHKILLSQNDQQKAKDFEQRNEEIFALIHIYLSPLIEPYDTYAKSMGEVIDVYFSVAKTGELTKADAERLPGLLKDFVKQKAEFIKELKSFIKTRRNEMIKRG